MPDAPTQDDLKRLEQEIDQLKSKHAKTTESAEAKTKVPVAWISLLSAGIGSAATVIVAFLAGSFSLQEKAAEKDTALQLEQAKFSYQLIQLALSEADVGARAQRLRFLLDIGLLENLDEAKLKIYAEPAGANEKDGSKPPPRLAYASPQRTLPGIDPDCQDFGAGTHLVLDGAGSKPNSIITVLKEELSITGTEASVLLRSVPLSLRCFGDVSEQDPLFLKLKAAGAEVHILHSSNPW